MKEQEPTKLPPSHWDVPMVFILAISTLPPTAQAKMWIGAYEFVFNGIEPHFDTERNRKVWFGVRSALQRQRNGMVSQYLRDSQTGQKSGAESERNRIDSGAESERYRIASAPDTQRVIDKCYPPNNIIIYNNNKDPQPPQGAKVLNLPKDINDKTKYNYDGLIRNLETLKVPKDKWDEIKRLGEFGKIGGCVWQVFNELRKNSKGLWSGAQNGGFIIKHLKEGRDEQEQG